MDNPILSVHFGDPGDKRLKNEAMDINFYFPTRLVFGTGKFATLGEEVSKLGKRALLVSYPSQSLVKVIQQAMSQLESHGVKTVLFAEATANPTNTLVDRGSELARREQCDVVIGLGGGSPMDTAKAIAVAAPEHADIWSIYEGKPILHESLPMVAVPTTAGTGSEATFYAVISNRELHRKEGFARSQFFPRVSIIDPQLTLSLPPRMTAETGMDTLTHAIEAYTSRLATPISDLFAAEAIRLVGKSLRQAVANGQDLDARTDMLLANTIAGIAITHADTCLAHVIGEAVGAVFNTPHGLSVSLSLPAVMEYNCLSNLVKYAGITRLLGAGEGLSDREAALKSPSLVRDLLRDIGLPSGLEAIGVSESSEVTELVNRPGMDASNPRPADAAAFALLIKGSLSPAMSYWEAGGN
jgi:alcohol dehydrogenase class IV